MSTNPDQTPTVRYPVQYPPDAGLQARRRVQEQRYSDRRRRHPVRRSVIALFVFIVVVAVLIIGDRVANAIAENDIADQVQTSGFPVKPSVTITGFPFLTQVAAHDIHQINISASNVPAGPIQLSSVKATATGVHLNSSFNGGTVDQINGTVLVTFAELASAGTGGGSSAVTISAAGSDKVAISAGGVALGDAQVSITGSNRVTVKPLGSGGVVSGIVSAIGGGTSFSGFSFTVPKLPAGLQLKSISVSSAGVQITASAHDTQLSQ
ncbi:MAG: LmeA family phospholipid-binding protein [Trebonia sp.]